MRIGPLRIIWLFIAALAAFIIFVRCLAEVGGAPDAIPQPHPTASATLAVQ